MALVAMFLLVLLLGIVDVGRAISANISVRDAVQDGASYGAYTRDATADDIKNRVRASVSSPDLSTATIDVYCDIDERDVSRASRIRVDLSYDVDLITPIMGAALGGSINLSPSAEAERFFDTCPAGFQPLTPPPTSTTTTTTIP
jgi:Flp pilus assembly protein TadG